MSYKKENERDVIANSVKRRPYGVKLTLLIEDNRILRIDGECCLLISPELILTIKPKNMGTKGNLFEVQIDGFSTAGEAEKFGLKVAFGFLWFAVKSQYSARLIYHTPLPCSVYDRSSIEGTSFKVYATASVLYPVESIIEPLDQIIMSNKNIDQRLLIAIELFTSAKLETTERSKFIGLVSALEPLAKQEKYEDEELKKLIKNFKQQIKSSNLDQQLKNSLDGRIDQLKLESVSKAIRRMVKEKLPGDNESIKIIENAYGLRSKILHEGATDADLQQKSNEVERVIKFIIEKHINEFLD